MAEPIIEWQVECNDIKSRMITMYETKSWTDCVFLFESNKLVAAHRNMLAAASPVFATMFFGGMPESGGPIRIEDIQPDTFISMLKYIYTDIIKISSFDDACALYYAAHKYRLVHLQKQCLNHLLANLTPEHCCLAYEFAQMFDENSLLNASKRVMKTHTMNVLNSDGFLGASVNTLQVIYLMDNLTITTELDLFKALERYIAARKKKSEEPSQNTASDNNIEDSKLKKAENENASSVEKGEATNNETVEVLKGEQITTRHIVKLIRFLTMSAEEFAKVPAVSTLLTQSEIVSILININDPKSSVPLPEGFSTIKTKRYLVPPENNCLYSNTTSGTDVNRSIAKFTFTVIECVNLRQGDFITFPIVYVDKAPWHVSLLISADGVKVSIKMKSIENYRRRFRLKIAFLSKLKDRLHSPYTFEGDTLNHTGYKIDAKTLGSLGNWDNIKSKYLVDGALTFDVELDAYYKW